jgi:hypothetical protein
MDIARFQGTSRRRVMRMTVKRVAFGMAIGYVLGARAGRERYEQIASAWRRVRTHPLVSSLAGRAAATTGATGRRAIEAVTGRQTDGVREPETGRSVATTAVFENGRVG